ncbi:tryptophan dimethylallyltransferase family protein [Streptomyces malaysiensis]|uniref:tryptophan dimethylallyltransferase family protein n=1 Tax=Streptomyces malaysiensis TaxID=92644 RepID=UPI000BFBDBDE|nr:MULTISPECIES: tryptophan dimethylallyltransferase family protein [Streptomyces]AUA13273.1 Tryptophan dimethylallyltransferase [Streptomyces sp. M56]MYX60129.1 prenyltransferase [Streptomyces sp. SID8382]QDL72415.1 prenyltransferase [Streptomyces malaysiensis]
MNGFRSGEVLLGDLATGQLTQLCQVAGLSEADTAAYRGVLIESLGASAGRPLALPPPSRTFLSDDHSPVEFSLAFLPGRAPDLRVLVEPGCSSGDDLAENGRAGLQAIHAMADRWGFSTNQLDRLEDLFFPGSPQGPLALWCALELRPGGVPGVKVYLNPSANGADRAAETIREALARLGHRQAFDSLPRAEGFPFFALDLGDWDAPRVKVYLKHPGLSPTEAGSLARMTPAPGREGLEEFFRTVGDLPAPGELGADDEGTDRLTGRPALTCHSFTETASGLPSGYTLHVPVRDYVRHDGEARERAVAVLRGNGMDSTALDRALAAVSPRPLGDGVGLIAYLALVHQRGRPLRVTVYVSSEAYETRPPRETLPTRDRVRARL